MNMENPYGEDDPLDDYMDGEGEGEYDEMEMEGEGEMVEAQE